MEYLSTVATADAMRKALKAAFPGVKFSVRSKVYAGGSSIDVSYEGIDHWVPITVCFCPGGPTVTDFPNRCDKCGAYGERTPVYKPGMPAREAVEVVAGRFEGKGFDGAIDLQYSIEAYIDDRGEVVGTRSRGTTSSRGSVAPWDDAPAGARVVSFGGYVHVRAD